MKLSFTLNGQPLCVDVAPNRRAVDLLREDLGVADLPASSVPDAPALDVPALDVPALDVPALDVKEGCGTGECGACSVLVDGVHKLSCLMLAAQLQGCEVLTAAGLGTQADPHPVQRAFAEHGAVQCGFCSPGMVVAASALLAQNPQPGREDIRRALSGNLCRCTGYVKIVDAVQAAAQEMAQAKGGSGGTP